MNKLFISFAVLLMTTTGFAQNQINPYPKTITVNGSAQIALGLAGQAHDETLTTMVEMLAEAHASNTK